MRQGCTIKCNHFNLKILSITKQAGLRLLPTIRLKLRLPICEFDAKIFNFFARLLVLFYRSPM